ncbi:MAG: thioredoxin family protein, partial [Verrucomicrobia bacterium]|nr:thioredoxin family protein [Verrucomicrobiota bacterium]
MRLGFLALAFAGCVALFGPQRSLAQVAGDDLTSFAAPAKHHTQVTLLLSAADAKPGDTIYAGVDMKMEPAWHTYWKNPGDAGQATKIEWQLPPGISAGEIQWPLPSKLPPAEVTTYGYEDEVVLIVPLTIETNSNLPMGQVDLKAKVSWLECKDTCIPADQAVAAKLNIAAETKPSADATTIEAWKNKIARPGDSALSAWWEKPATGDTRPLIIGYPQVVDASKNIKYDSVDFFPDASDKFEVQSATETISHYSAYIRLRKTVKKFSGDWPKEISGVLVVGIKGQRYGFDVKLPVAEKEPITASSKPSGGTTRPPLLPPLGILLWQLLGALAGGIIMNLMPCVLPILSLKILSLVQQHGKESAVARRHSLVYLFGVLVSFWLIAGLVMAGKLASWGEQFQDPRFVVIITVLMTVIALNLFGVFEFILPGKAVGSAAELAAREGHSGAFFNGVLAVVLGASCVAPLMGAAIGWAITQSPLVILLIFSAIGLGLALPYVLLTFFPALQKILPKPGAWMEKFKIALGFPMLGMAAWPLSLVVVHYGQTGALWVGIFLVALGLGAWVFGEFIQRGSRRKWLAWLVVLATIGGGYSYALEHQLNWRHPNTDAIPKGTVQTSPNNFEWLPWSEDAVAQAQAAGHPVLVDFTADWCLTCQVNRKTSIEIDSVRAKLKAINAVTLVGDYTRKNPAIAAELKRFQWAGVP